MNAGISNIFPVETKPYTTPMDKEGELIEMERPERIYRGLASTFIVLVLGAQAATLPVTLMSPGRLLGRFYPIIEYPMYAQAHYDGERVVGRFLLRGVLADGSQVDITEQSLRISVWDFVVLTEQVATGTPDSPGMLRAVKNLLAIVREREPRVGEFKTLQIDSYPMKLSRDGAAPAPSETVWSIPMS
jgi:hypothetical protein